MIRYTDATAWKELAAWSNRTLRPQRPELIPGLPSVNAQLIQDYRERLVAWKVGKAEALLYGLEKN
jgi:hypothetical protein